METRARYVLVGSFTLAVLLAVFTFTYWLQNTVGLGQVTYRVRFNQPVSGLSSGAAVLFNGARVGTVSGLELDQQDPRRLTATIAVNAGTPIRSDTTVDITSQGLTGAPTIALKGGSADAPRLTAQNGQPPTLTAGPDVGRNLTESVQHTLNQLDSILNENAKPLHTAITGISTFADMLGKNSGRVEGLIGGLEKLTGVGSEQQQPKVYDLAAATEFARFEKSIGAPMVVPDPSSILLFDSQRILIRTQDGTWSNVKGGQWADNLPKLMQARIVQSFENADQLAKVSRPLDMMEGAYRLELGIRSFQLAPEPKPAALVEFSARVVDDKGEVIAARMFKTSEPAQSLEAPDAVAALNAAFAKATHELVEWTVAEVPMDAAPPPEPDTNPPPGPSAGAPPEPGAAPPAGPGPDRPR
jgi:phospholipid/cholesterol/gamma-HCH transport system substrate-binding protein